MKMNNGEDWQPEDADILRWQKAYPAVDVFAELNAMEAWCDANPTRRKKPGGIKRFVNSWLARAQDKGGSPFAKEQKRASGKVGLRSWSNDDMLTHDFLNDPNYQKYCLEKYGQFMSYGGNRVTRGRVE